MRSSSGRLLVGFVVAVVLGVSGCAAMPESGPIVPADVSVAADISRASDIDPLPPSQDESPTAIVTGFLDAMQASPSSPDVAKQYLTTTAASGWLPGRSTITYDAALPPVTAGSEVNVTLVGADRLDRRGTWRGPLGQFQRTLSFHVVVDDQGQYRIDNPPDALVVPDTWYAQRYRQVSLYYFDRTGHILVPEPVFVPVGDQFTTTLVSSLLAGPGDDLRRTVRTYLRLRPSSLSVPVSADGVAQIDLEGSTGGLSQYTMAHLLAQLAYTLRQNPDLTGLSLSLGGTDAPLPGGGDVYPIDQSSSFDPNVVNAATGLYGLRGGVLATAFGVDFESTDGPLGTKPRGLRSVTTSIQGRFTAGVTRDGRSVLVAPTGAPVSADGVNGPASPTGGAQRARRVVRDGIDLLPPAWDSTGRLWLVDRRKGTAQVSFVPRTGRQQVVRVPGVTGRDVTSFLVSRDGTRFVAVVHGKVTDTVRIGRMQVDSHGRVTGISATDLLAGSAADPLDVRDVSWVSDTAVGVLTPLVPGVSDVTSLPVDGSPASADDLRTTVQGSAIGLAASPTPGQTPYAVTRTGLIDLTSGRFTPYPAGPAPTSVDYVG